MIANSDERDAAEDRDAQRELRRDQRCACRRWASWSSISARRAVGTSCDESTPSCAAPRRRRGRRSSTRTGRSSARTSAIDGDRQQAVERARCTSDLADHQQAHRRVDAEQELHRAKPASSPSVASAARSAAGRACGWRRAARGSARRGSRRRSAGASVTPSVWSSASRATRPEQEADRGARDRAAEQPERRARPAAAGRRSRRRPRSGRRRRAAARPTTITSTTTRTEAFRGVTITASPARLHGARAAGQDLRRSRARAGRRTAARARAGRARCSRSRRVADRGRSGSRAGRATRAVTSASPT